MTHPDAPATPSNPSASPDPSNSAAKSGSPSVSHPAVQRWSDIPPEQLNPLLTRQFVTGAQAMIARIVLLKGCKVPTHSHANEQIGFILSGALRFILDGATVDVRAGELLVIPPNVPHSAEALEDTINFDIFAPPRQDWIAGDDSYLR